MKYDYILFDADDTLFHFDAFSGLQQMFSRYQLPFDQDEFQRYQRVNMPLWQQYQDGQISATDLQQRRFEPYAGMLGVSALQLNQEFLLTMARLCTLLPGARELLDFLKGKARLGIITNGFTAMQQARLEHCGVVDLFDPLVISEQVGVAKPDPKIFQHAFRQLGEPDKSRILMVGDNPHSDVLGAQNAGIDSCWLNTTAQPLPVGISPTYQITSLFELPALLHHPI
ncbi:dUMP phosphatase [Rheinheimera riviphila]|uniref:DUMP phosphatase n=1 Tax=Rheinheimera riviphila TaxID=1834037 RepID=A0A437QZQ1_9GAMM|nr:dUMP phosphatase [Rheinheimera riviphila]